MSNRQLNAFWKDTDGEGLQMHGGVANFHTDVESVLWNFHYLFDYDWSMSTWKFAILKLKATQDQPRPYVAVQYSRDYADFRLAVCFRAFFHDHIGDVLMHVCGKFRDDYADYRDSLYPFLVRDYCRLLDDELLPPLRNLIIPYIIGTQFLDYPFQTRN